MNTCCITQLSKICIVCELIFNVNAKLLGYVIDGFIYEFIFSTLCIYMLFIFSCFNAQLPLPHTYGHSLVHRMLIVSKIFAMVGTGNKVITGILWNLTWHNDIRPSPAELTKWQDLLGGIPKWKIVTRCAICCISPTKFFFSDRQSEEKMTIKIKNGMVKYIIVKWCCLTTKWKCK